MGNINGKEKRLGLFGLLAHVLNVSKEKFDKEKALNDDRQKWARIIISGVEAYGRLLEAVQIEELERRLEALEKPR
jgi:hypothetical protein